MGKLSKPVDVNVLVEKLKGELPRLPEEFSVKSLGLFGSYLRGEQKRDSDLDILVEFTEIPGMFRYLALERDLSRVLGAPVDLVMKEALKPAIGKRILNEVRQV